MVLINRFRGKVWGGTGFLVLLLRVSIVVPRLQGGNVRLGDLGFRILKSGASGLILVPF